MSIRDTQIASLYSMILSRSIVPLLARFRVTPNVLTLLGLGFACLVPLGFLFWSWAGLAALTLSGILDSLDGLVARETQNMSPYGAFLDSTTDRISDFLYLLGFWFLFWRLEQPMILSGSLIFSSFLFTVLISYTKAKIEGLGGRCEKGFMSRAVRVLYLFTWTLIVCFLPNPLALWVGLAVYWLLTLHTFVYRILIAHRELS